MKQRSLVSFCSVYFWGAIMCIGLGSSSAIAQSANSDRADTKSLVDSVQELRTQVQELRTAVAEMRSEATKSKLSPRSKISRTFPLLSLRIPGMSSWSRVSSFAMRT